MELSDRASSWRGMAAGARVFGALVVATAAVGCGSRTTIDGEPAPAAFSNMASASSSSGGTPSVSGSGSGGGSTGSSGGVIVSGSSAGGMVSAGADDAGGSPSGPQGSNPWQRGRRWPRCRRYARKRRIPDHRMWRIDVQRRHRPMLRPARWRSQRILHSEGNAMRGRGGGLLERCELSDGQLLLPGGRTRRGRRQRDLPERVHRRPRRRGSPAMRHNRRLPHRKGVPGRDGIRPSRVPLGEIRTVAHGDCARRREPAAAPSEPRRGVCHRRPRPRRTVTRGCATQYPCQPTGCHGCCTQTP